VAAARAVHACAAVFSSDLQRAARTTGEHRVGDDPGGAAAVVVDPRLRERDAGEWTGLTRPEIEQRDPGALHDGRRPPGFEPDSELSARALAALEACAAGLADGASALVVTHGGVIRSVERALGGGGEAIPNLGGRRILTGVDGLTLGETLLLLDASTEVTIPRQL
jgi:broad specificity phosphatase PhoE